MAEYSAPQYTDLGQRAASYWFIDGLPELASGLAFAAMSGTALLWRVYLPYWWMQILFAITSGLYIVFLVSQVKILDWLKSYFTYPRTGYVRPPKTGDPSSSNLATLIIASPPQGSKNVIWLHTLILLIAFTASNLMKMIGDPRVIPLMMIGMALALYLISQAGDRSYSFLSVVPLLLLGVALVRLHVSLLAGQFLPVFAVGLWLFFRGLVMLIGYLWRNPRPHAVEGTRP